MEPAYRGDNPLSTSFASQRRGDNEGDFDTFMNAGSLLPPTTLTARSRYDSDLENSKLTFESLLSSLRKSVQQQHSSVQKDLDKQWSLIYKVASQCESLEQQHAHLCKDYFDHKNAMAHRVWACIKEEKAQETKLPAKLDGYGKPFTPAKMSADAADADLIQDLRMQMVRVQLQQKQELEILKKEQDQHHLQIQALLDFRKETLDFPAVVDFLDTLQHEQDQEKIRVQDQRPEDHRLKSLHKSLHTSERTLLDVCESDHEEQNREAQDQRSEDQNVKSLRQSEQVLLDALEIDQEEQNREVQETRRLTLRSPRSSLGNSARSDYTQLASRSQLHLPDVFNSQLETHANIREYLEAMKEQLTLELRNEISTRIVRVSRHSEAPSSAAGASASTANATAGNLTDPGAGDSYNLERCVSPVHVASIMDHLPNLATFVEDKQYHWNESVWDLAMLIYVPDMGTLGSALVSFLTLLNVFMQVFLCLLINDNFTNPRIDDQTATAMCLWRVYSGHAWDLVDKITYQPLVRRICNRDTSVAISSGVSELFETVGTYRPSEAEYLQMNPFLGKSLPHIHSVGTIMCLFAIVIWLLSLGTDVKESIGVFHGLYGLTVETATRIENADDGGKFLASMSKQRKIYCYSLVMVKFLISNFLCVSGTLYIAHTIQVEDLLLNAAALQIVLRLDEMLFSALAPLESHVLLMSLKPLQRGWARSVWGLNIWPMFSTFFIVVVSFVTYVVVLSPQNRILDDVRDALCGGNIDFVMMLDPAGVLYAAQAPISQSYDELRRGYVGETFSKVMSMSGSVDAVASNFSSDGYHVASGMIGAFFSLHSINSRSASDTISIHNPLCQDTDQVYQYAVRIVRAATRHNGQRCEDFVNYCSTDGTAGVRTRQFCPVTCGCADPASWLVVHGEDNGCPDHCKRLLKFQTSLNRSCTEASTFADNIYLTRYVKGLQDFRTSVPASAKHDVTKMIQQIQTHGCSVVQYPPGINPAWQDLCIMSSSWQWKPFSYACPITCRCEQLNMALCPDTCARSIGSI